MVVLENVCLETPDKKVLNMNHKDTKGKSTRGKMKKILQETLQPRKDNGKNKHYPSRQKVNGYEAVPETDQRVSDWISNHFSDPQTRRQGTKSLDHVAVNKQALKHMNNFQKGEETLASNKYNQNIETEVNKPKPRRRKSYSVCLEAETNADLRTNEHTKVTRVGRTAEQQSTKQAKTEEIGDTKVKECRTPRSPYRRSQSVDSSRDQRHRDKHNLIKSLEKSPLVARSTLATMDEQKRYKREKSYESLNSLVQNTQICYSLLHLTQMSAITDVCSVISSPSSTLKRNRRCCISLGDSRSRKSSEQKSCELMEGPSEEDVHQSPIKETDVDEQFGDDHGHSSKEESLSTIGPPGVCHVDIVVSPPPPDVCEDIPTGVLTQAGPDVCSMIQSNQIAQAKQPANKNKATDNVVKGKRKG